MLAFFKVVMSCADLEYWLSILAGGWVKRTKILKYSHIIIILVHNLIPYGEVDMQDTTKGANLSDI